VRQSFDYQTGYDVVVCGGGMAGVAAALAAARHGRKTCLLEKTVFPGGLATAGNVLIYLPLSDRRGRQVTFGLAEELLKASIAYGPGEVHVINDYAQGHQSVFNPASFILALDELLLAAGVEVWFDSLVCGVQTARGTITGVAVENKSGRGLVKGKTFVDATGDADLAFRAGAPCAVQENFMTIWAAGASPALDKAIRDRLGFALPVSSFDLDIDAAKTKIAALDAVAEVELRVAAGGVFEVAVTERRPALIWRQGEELELIDGAGRRVAMVLNRADRPDLPVIAGIGAGKAAPEALQIIAATGPLLPRMRGLVRMGERRWDLVLDRNQRILLPADNPVRALERLLALDKAEDLLKRDILTVDLRNAQRPTLRLAPHALKALRRAQGIETAESDL